MIKKMQSLIILSIVILSLILVGCAGDTDEDTTESESVAESLDYTITGIEPGAGATELTDIAIEEYGLEGYSQDLSSGAAMTQALGTAIENEEPIVVVGWSPHWKFQTYDLKYLEDPKGIYEEDSIVTIVRKGLKEDMPEAYEILDNFFWPLSEMESVMLALSEGVEPEVAGREWVDNNQDLVSQWTDGVDHVDGDEIEIAYIPWDSEIASTNVIKTVLEDMGFNVNIIQVELGPMFYAVASGNSDASISPWLPLHNEFYEDLEDELENLGTNVEGARTGLVVPTYMDIDSIEDLAD